MGGHVADEHVSQLLEEGVKTKCVTLQSNVVSSDEKGNVGWGLAQF